MWSGRLTRSGMPEVRETCHPAIVNSSNTAKNGNDVRHKVIGGVYAEKTNTGGVPTSVASHPYSAMAGLPGGGAIAPVDVTPCWRLGLRARI